MKNFSINSLVNEKVITEVDSFYHILLKDGRIPLGVSSSMDQYNFKARISRWLLIYESDNFQFCFSIEGYGDRQCPLEKGNFLAQTEKNEDDEYFSVLEIKKILLIFYKQYTYLIR